MAGSWFPMFPRDFLAATCGWTAEERGHYVQLLLVQWEQGSIPDEPRRLELISPGVTACWERVADKFPVWSDGRRRNNRLEHERAKSEERSERARQSASASWAARRAAEAPRQDSPSPPDCPDTQPCERICDGISERICLDDASMTMLISPPPPPQSREEPAGWHGLLAAWNASRANRQPWRASEAPPEAIARLAEPGWLDDALAGIKAIEAGQCRHFRTDVGLRQFCGRNAKGSFVARLLGGEFADRPREPAPRGRIGQADDRPPAKPFSGKDDAAFQATRARLEREKAERERQGATA